MSGKSTKKNNPESFCLLYSLYSFTGLNSKKMTELELKNGKEFHFDNEKWNEETQSDDFRAAHCLWREDKKHSWATGFQLWFNGALLHTCKTFSSLQNRLDKLSEKWHLEPSELENA